MNSPLKFQTLFKFQGSSNSQNGNRMADSNDNNVILPPISYASLLPNIPITPHIVDQQDMNISNISNMSNIPPPPSTFDVVSPRKGINNINGNKLLKFDNDDSKSPDEQNPNIMSSPEESIQNSSTEIAETELLNEIEIERTNTMIKTQKITELHQEYDIKLQHLKNILSRIKIKASIIEEMEDNNNNNNNLNESLENILREKQEIYHSYVRTQSSRLHDQKQLTMVEGQNHNLKSIIYSLNQQLKNVVNKYQTLQHQQQQQANSFQYEPDCSTAMGNNQYFQEMLDENRTLERQIKFLKHIIHQEIERYQWNNIDL